MRTGVKLFFLRASSEIKRVARPSEKFAGKDAGEKVPPAPTGRPVGDPCEYFQRSQSTLSIGMASWPLRTFCDEDAVQRTSQPAAVAL